MLPLTMVEGLMFYDIFPPEIIKIILDEIKNTKNFKLILNCRLVCKHWHSKFKNVEEYNYRKELIKRHILNKIALKHNYLL